MVTTNRHPVFDSWGRQMFTSLNKMFYLIKDPWITYSGTADHNSIHAIAIFIFQGFFGRINISVTKNWNFDAGIIFHFTDQCPVSFTFVHLSSCTTMNS